jgi:hypothetical protein
MGFPSQVSLFSLSPLAVASDMYALQWVGVHSGTSALYFSHEE